MVATLKFANMQRSDFIDPSTGILTPTIGKQHAFVPAPLPPTIALGDIAITMSEAMQAVGELKGACRRFPNPYILVRPLQRQEALTSSAMEGTFTTADNLLLAEVGVEKQGDDSTREVVNYLKALEGSLKLLKQIPISHRVITSAHETLLSGLSTSRGASKRPGNYKSDQNWIGGATIDKARFIPPPPKETQVCMDQLEAYLNREGSDFPTPLMDLALVHYQLEAIHPFADGNGRVGRMLISLMAVQRGMLDIPILYMSPALERHRDTYIDLMYNVSARGEWAEWLNFFFKRIAESCREAVATVDKLIDLQVQYRTLAAKAGRSTSLLTLVDFLFERPAITVPEAAKKLGVTYPAAKVVIDKLLDQRILSPFEGQYPRVYFAPGIIIASRPPSDTGLGEALLQQPSVQA